MDANLVNILLWTKPYKSAAAIISINVILWFLIRQRPLCVLPLVLLCYYLRYLWKHRIRTEILVDPPDHEEWTTLSTYDFEQVTCNFGKTIWTSWTSLRHENHTMWAIGTCVLWVILAKIGSQLDFLTFLFVISNALFMIGPLMKCLPKELFTSPGSGGSGAQPDDFSDLIPELPAADTKATRSKTKSNSKENSESAEEAEEKPPSEPKANFATSLLNRFSPSRNSSDSRESSVSPGPESLTPSTALPDFDQDSDDEFLFDTKHFESSSSSTSNSFELIHF